MLKIWRVVSMMICALGCALTVQAQAAKDATKPAIRGLVTMGDVSFIVHPEQHADNTLKEANAHPGVYAGVVLLARWKDLEPERGHFDFATLDAGLDAIRKYNAKYPKTPVVGKLRIFGAAVAPAWAMQLDGGPVVVNHKDANQAIGHFWSVPYRDAWRELQTKLAQRYDNDPLIEEVAISSCAAVSAEPFVTPLTPENVPVLKKAGFTDEAMQACLSGAVDDYSAWKHVALDFTFNPWRNTRDGQITFEESFTEKVMNDFRKRLGSRAVIANHGIIDPLFPRDVAITSQIAALGGPIEYQTIGGNVDWDKAVALSEKLGVTEMEFWDSRQAGGAAKFTQQQLETWKQQSLAKP